MYMSLFMRYDYTRETSLYVLFITFFCPNYNNSFSVINDHAMNIIYRRIHSVAAQTQYITEWSTNNH